MKQVIMNKKAGKNVGFKSTLKQELRAEENQFEATDILAAHKARLADENETLQFKYKDLEMKMTTNLNSLAGL